MKAVYTGIAVADSMNHDPVKADSTITRTVSSTMEPADNDDLNEPLLTKQQKRETKQLPCRVQAWSLLCGTIIGLFTQLSSLGAYCFLLNSHRLLYYSVIWSIVVTFMGIGVLLAIRNLLRDFCTPHELLRIECSFAIGATLGVNVAWTVTNAVLGLDSHHSASLLAIAVTLIWCKIVLFCMYHHDENDETGVDNQDAVEEV